MFSWNIFPCTDMSYLPPSGTRLLVSSKKKASLATCVQIMNFVFLWILTWYILAFYTTSRNTKYQLIPSSYLIIHAGIQSDLDLLLQDFSHKYSVLLLNVVCLCSLATMRRNAGLRWPSAPSPYPLFVRYITSIHSYKYGLYLQFSPSNSNLFLDHHHEHTHGMLICFK